jgi:pimeloyl-ACP methyl ester carboxylesterase
VIEDLPAEVGAAFPFAPHWAGVEGFNLHYVDEGPSSRDAVLLLHGNPTWAFLYRKVIPTVAAAGYRVIAPDFLGSGRSDHGTNEWQYQIAHHVRRTLAVLDAAGVERAVMFCQDWGGPIGMGCALARTGLLRGLGLGNTFWGEASEFHRRVFPWRALHGPVVGPLFFNRRRVFVDGARLGMPDSVATDPVAQLAYRLPWQRQGSYLGTLAWPRAISLGPDHPTQPLADALWTALGSWDVPVRFVWGGADPVFPWAEQGEALRDRLPRGREADPVVVVDGRHFIQEFAPDEIAAAMIELAHEGFT